MVILKEHDEVKFDDQLNVDFPDLTWTQHKVFLYMALTVLDRKTDKTVCYLEIIFIRI